MSERRIVDIAPHLDDLKKELDKECDHPTAVYSDEAIADDIDTLEALPVIDPESLRSESEWELNPCGYSCEYFRCKKCHHTNCDADNYCGGCGAKMKNAGVKLEDLPIPKEGE